MFKWLNRWIRPTEEKRRAENLCHCGNPMIRYYSKNIYHCYQCSRDYKISDGLEIRHQR